MDQDDVVRVRAVVMTRDDSSGGWVPLGGPGLSHVAICRLPHSDESGQLRFLIRGERIRDQTTILECGLKKDLVYNKVNPIFHHWKVDNVKFGLTFQSPADAVSFERSINSTIKELVEVQVQRFILEPNDPTLEYWNTQCSCHVLTTTDNTPPYPPSFVSSSDFKIRALGSYGAPNSKIRYYSEWRLQIPQHTTRDSRLEQNPCSVFIYTSPKPLGSLSSLSSAHSEAGAPEDVAATLTDSESSANSQKEMLPKHITIVTSQSSSSCYIRSPASDRFRLGVTPGSAHPNQVPSQPLQGSSLKVEDEGEIARPCRDSGPLKGYEDYRRAALGGREADKVDLCVHFAKGEGRVAGSSQSECPLKEAKGSPACHIDTLPSGGLRKGNGAGGGDGRGPSTAGEEDMAPSRCIYCRDVFQDNGPGRCRDAPDPAEHCVRQLSCMWCAESMLYHCMSDSEGDYSDPCSCEASSRHHLCARWVALVALSALSPCMCCYLPLRACHHCGQRWGCCGGKHKAVR
ncbi:sprouty-related, EVH1 domain-containing protein 1 [Stegostoma tigrinum]|uniref:sprouty-related, EVH1 domain-containing protein 1 n=1 Tax=Stegostoma tigrinum TaxID=3053191 RepID=UPI00286FD0F3|nr:sprouty-related, EVH1 domain-containing protein 1 [Stegostoma tigrinum]